MRLPKFPDKPLLDIAFLLALLAAALSFDLGARPYSAPSEARYIEIGREMAASGDLVTPRLNYVKYFEKPPLFYWIQAAATKLGGVDPFVSRIPTAAFALLLCVLTYGLGRMLYGRKAGLLGALVMGTSLYLFALSRVVLLDVPVSFFMTATLTAFLYAVNAPPSRARTFVLYCMYASAACAVLTKGLIGIVLPGAVIFLWLCFTKRWALLKTLRLCSGIILFLLISVPWHIMVAMRNPEWAHFYFIHEHFERYTTREHKRYQPDWFFIPVLLGGFFPWLPHFYQSVKDGVQGAWQKRHENGNALFLIIWVLFIFVFFSLSDSKLIPYILPVFPPIAVWLGRYFATAWEERDVTGFGWGVFFAILMFSACSAGLLMLPQLVGTDSKVFEAIAQASDEIHNFAIVCLVSAGLLLVVAVQGQRRHVILAMLAISLVVIEIGNDISGHYDKDTMAVLSAVIKEADKSGTAEVANYGDYNQDLPLYLNHRITLVDWKGELEFGAAHEDTSAWMIDSKEFWKRWNTKNHLMFVVMRYNAFKQLTQTKKAQDLHLNMVYQSGRNILFTNVAPESLGKK